jgi:serine/threonine-protein kinase HipA
MKRTLAIAPGDDGRGLATLRHDVRGARENAAFEYAAEWLAAEDRFAVEPGLPLVAAASMAPDSWRSRLK